MNVRNGLDAQGLGEDDIDQNDPERKRRRRRSRRGRRGADEGSNQDGREDQAPENAGFDHVSSNALSGAPVNYVEHSSTPISTPTVTAAPVSAPAVPAPAVPAPVVPAPVVAAPVVTAPVAAAPVAAAPVIAAPLATPAPAAFVQTETAPVISAPIAAPVQVTSATEQPASVTVQATVQATAPVTAPAPTPAPVQVALAPSAPILEPVARADNATLHAIVQTAGLQWVESDPVRVAQAMANQRVSPIKLGREPKPRVAVSSEPLVQVETSR